MHALSNFSVPDTWGPRPRLLVRHLAADVWRPGVIVTLVVMAVGPGVILPVAVASILTSVNDQIVATAAPGQLMVTGRGGDTSAAPDPDVVAALTAAAPSAARSVRVWAVMDDTVTASTDASGLHVAAVSSVEDAEAISNHALDRADLSALADGAVLSWRGGRLLALRGTEADLVSVSVRPSGFDRSWQELYSGIMLTSRAEDLGLPLTETSRVFVGVGDKEGAAMRDEVYAAGLEVSAVYPHRPPVPYELPLGLTVASSGATLILITTAVALTTVQVRSLRRYADRLLALGLGRRWIGSVVAGESVILNLVGVTIGLAVVVAPVLAVAAHVPTFTITVPWNVLAASTGVWLLAGGAAVALMLRRTTGSSRDVV